MGRIIIDKRYIFNPLLDFKVLATYENDKQMSVIAAFLETGTEKQIASVMQHPLIGEET